MLYRAVNVVCICMHMYILGDKDFKYYILDSSSIYFRHFLKMAVVIIKIMLIAFANTIIINNVITTRVSKYLLNYDNYANTNVYFVYPVNSQISLYQLDIDRLKVETAGNCSV